MSRDQEPLFLTDTTFCDASVALATRIRTRDMLRVADAYARLCPNIFSIEMWGGATSTPPCGSSKTRGAAALASRGDPQHPFQMLLRGSGTVGYTGYQATWWKPTSSGARRNRRVPVFTR
jgi:pyruvate carboxylase